MSSFKRMEMTCEDTDRYKNTRAGRAPRHVIILSAITFMKALRYRSDGRSRPSGLMSSHNENTMRMRQMVILEEKKVIYRPNQRGNRMGKDPPFLRAIFCSGP